MRGLINVNSQIFDMERSQKLRENERKKILFNCEKRKPYIKKLMHGFINANLTKIRIIHNNLSTQKFIIYHIKVS